MKLANSSLYADLASFIQDYKKQESSQKGFTSLKDTEIFQSLVYLARVCQLSTNGRPRARIFLELLRQQYPQRELQPQVSRIIAP
jgi:Trp operon repressor